VIDDEAAIRELLATLLAREGFQVISVPDAERAWPRIQDGDCDLLVLDLVLPGMSGLELLTRVRAVPACAPLPVLILSARDAELDKLLCFERGADDYLSKPFSPRELVARLHVLLRRAARRADDGVLKVGPLEIKLAAREVLHHGHEVALAPREYELLRFLAEHPGRVVSRRELLRKVWGFDFGGDERTIDVHVHRLRQKLHGAPPLIQTVIGAGYKLASRPTSGVG